MAEGGYRMRNRVPCEDLYERVSGKKRRYSLWRKCWSLREKLE